VDVAVLTSAQVPVLPTVDIVALTTGQVRALSTSAVQAMTTDQVAALSTDQVAAMTTAQTAALPSTQLSVLSLSTTQVALLTTSQIMSLGTDQIASLSTDQVRAISTQDIAVLLTDQILALQTADLLALSTDQVAAITSTQAGVMTTTQVEAFSSSQISAFTTAASSALTLGSPIILDLNGDGVKTLSISAGVKFDLFATGNAVNTGWVSSCDGLLVLDRNHDGQINDGSELFGSATKLANVQTSPDGYTALRELDANHDGIIDSKDAAFSDLKLWVDRNSDGVTETGELKSLASLNIASISVNAQVGSATDSGNILGLTSTYQTTDGASHTAADVWFLADKASAVAPAVPPVEVVPAVPEALGYANAVGGISASAMRANVSALAQAIGAFPDSHSTVGDPATDVSLTLQSAMPPGNPLAAAAVVNMVDVMKQFDANGNPAGAPTASVSMNVAPSASGLIGQASNLATTPLAVSNLR
jgi:hypothetical protein